MLILARCLSRLIRGPWRTSRYRLHNTLKISRSELANFSLGLCDVYARFSLEGVKQSTSFSSIILSHHLFRTITILHCPVSVRAFLNMLQVAVPSSSSPFSLEEYHHPLPNTLQIPQDPALPANDRPEADPGSHLVVSPYTTLPHLLDLRTLEESQRLLAKALTALQSVRDDYATAPYRQSFNWDGVIERLKSLAELSEYQWKRQHFYIVVFRSQVPQTTDRTHLGVLDQYSHVEATKSGGLLKYWFGLPDENGRNLATCNSLFCQLDPQRHL